MVLRGCPQRIRIFEDNACFCQLFLLGKLCEELLHEQKFLLAREGMESRA